MTLTNFYYLNERGSKKNQEDFIWPAPRTVGPGNKIFIVCDGVGGSSNGEVASRLVAEYMGHALTKKDPSAVSVESVNELLLKARNALSEYARAENAGNDMATTFTLLLLHAGKAFIAWCGDSRVYHFREGRIIYKTEDHSLVNTLVKSGEITESDASIHPQKNIILKAVRADSSIVDAEGGWTSGVQTSDYFLLCTDGLLENWSDEELTALIAKNDQGHTNLSEIINKKSLNKTRDNYSMYLLQVSLEEKNAAKKRNKTGVVVILLLLFAAVMTSIAYSINQKKNKAVVTDKAMIKKTIVVPLKESGTPATGSSPHSTQAKESAKKIEDSVQAPVHFEITNPEKDTTRAKTITATAVNKKIPNKKNNSADSSAAPAKKQVKEKKDTTDLNHR